MTRHRSRRRPGVVMTATSETSVYCTSFSTLFEPVDARDSFLPPQTHVTLLCTRRAETTALSHRRRRRRYVEEYFNKLEARIAAEGKSMSLTKIWGQHLVELARSVDHIMEESEGPDDES